jgi:hypothetical protein
MLLLLAQLTWLEQQAVRLLKQAAEASVECIGPWADRHWSARPTTIAACATGRALAAAAARSASISIFRPWHAPVPPAPRRLAGSNSGAGACCSTSTLVTRYLVGLSLLEASIEHTWQAARQPDAACAPGRGPWAIARDAAPRWFSCGVHRCHAMCWCSATRHGTARSLRYASRHRFWPRHHARQQARPVGPLRRRLLTEPLPRLDQGRTVAHRAGLRGRRSSCRAMRKSGDRCAHRQRWWHDCVRAQTMFWHGYLLLPLLTRLSFAQPNP